MVYYWTNDVYQGAWSTTTSTTALNDGSPADVTTSIAWSGSGANKQITAFYDNGSVQQLGAWQFTEIGQYFSGVDWILEGSADTSSWTTIASGNAAYAGGSPITVSGTNVAVYRYFRLSIKTVNGGGPPLTMSDWRLTMSAVANSKRLTTLGIGS